MNENLIMIILGMLLLLGCISAPEQVTKDELAENMDISERLPEMELISVKGNSSLSVVEISAYEKGGKWIFPIENYTDEFLEVGLHSDAFIKLNNSHLMFLDDEESVWLHPMINKNQTVLFDAIYSREIKNCSATETAILGKKYPLSQLQDGSSYENDDKWKVAFEKEGGCLKRIVIYLDGYFYDLGQEQISLFRNDNTILFWFNDTKDEPSVKVIGTMPAGGSLEGKGGAGDNDIRLEFSHPVPMTCFGCFYDGLLVENNERITADINGAEWVVTQLTNESIEMGFEEQFKTLFEGDNTTTIQTKNKSWYVKNHECIGDFCDQIYSNINDDNETVRFHSGETKSVDGKYVHVWNSLTWGPFPYQSTVSVLSKRVLINTSDVEFFRAGDYLLSLRASENSTSFEKLTG